MLKEREQINVALGKGEIPLYTKVPTNTINEINDLRKKTGGMAVTKLIPLAIHYLHIHKDDVSFIIESIE